MAYNNAIPQANDSLKNSQSQLLANFQAIKTLIDVNHETFGSANEGKHKWVTFPVQGAVTATAAGEVNMYSANGAISGVPELWIQKQSAATAFEFTSSLGATNGWTRLPSGILLKWGTLSTTTYNTKETIAFPVGATIPVFSNIYSVQVTTATAESASPNQVVILGNFTTTTLNVFARQLLGIGGATAFTFFAIGN